MRPEIELITASAPIHASSADIDRIDHLLYEVTDWNFLLDMMVKNCAAGLLYRKLPLLKNNNLIPIETQKLLKKAYQTTFIHNTRIYTEFVYLKEVLQLHSIPFLTLKGICMAEWLYGDIGLRQMSDIDLLIHEEDGVRCLDSLHAAGYVSQQEFMVDAFVDAKSQNHFNPLFRNDVMVEIHIRLQNTREIYQQNLKEVWRDAVSITLNAVETLRLELSDMLIHACLHLDKHFVTEGVQFTSFNDIVNLLRGIDNGQQTTDDGKRVKSKESRLKIEEIEDFWERFDAKCIQYNFADTVFTYLIVVAHYYKAPLPQYLVDKYSSLLNEEVKNRFENFLAGTGNEFIGRGAPKSATEAHLRHLKQLRNPVDFMRYVKGVVFPGKEFMISKYIENKEPRTKNQDDRKDTSSHHHIVISKFWWLWYPYRYYCGIKGFWYVVTGNTEKKKEK